MTTKDKAEQPVKEEVVIKRLDVYIRRYYRSNAEAERELELSSRSLGNMLDGTILIQPKALEIIGYELRKTPASYYYVKKR